MNGKSVGLSSGFAPSPQAAQAALGGKNVIETRSHPMGAAGAKLSLEEVAKRINTGRNDPRVKAWAGKVLIEGGKPTDVVLQAKVLLAALRRQTMYVADPVGTEMMAKASTTLCLDDHGLCMPAGDCDDLCVAFGAAAMSVGIPVQVVGQAFGTSIATHVIDAIQDERGRWYRVDPSSTYDVGGYFHATQEWWVDPQDGKVTGMGNATSGDFVGIGQGPGQPGQPAYGAPQPLSPIQGTNQGGVAPTFGGPFGGPNQAGVKPIQSPNPVYGIDWDCYGDDCFALGKANRSFALGQGVTQQAFDAVTGQLEAAVFALERARNSLGAGLTQVTNTRLLLNPAAPFDPEPPTPITSVADFPGNGVWTQAMDGVATQLYDIADQLVQVGHSALTGARKVYLDPAAGTFIEAKTGDPWSLHAVVQTAEDLVFGFFDAAGNLLSGFSSKDGTALTAAQVQAIQGQKAPGTGQAPLVVLGAVAGLAVVGIAAYFIVAKWADAASTAAKEATNQQITGCIAKGNCPPGMLDLVQKNRVAEAQAQAATDANNPFVASTANIANAFKWIAIGGITVAAIVAVAPYVQAEFAKHR